MKFLILQSLLFVIALAIAANAHSADEWRGRTIYQVLTDRFAKSSGSSDQPCGDLSNYCGGNYDAMTDHLDYIEGMGFDAIWITPIVDNIGNGYHGYWLKDLYALNDHFGSGDSLKNFINKCHDRGIWVMLDIVGNHVGPVGMDFSQINPFNSADCYHDRCQITDWNNQTQVEICRLADLPDLKQENPDVANKLLQWINDTTQEYGFDGIRVDTAREVPKWFWTQFTAAADAYTVGEIFDGRVDLVAGYQGPLSGVLSYPLSFSLRNVFQESQTMKQIESTLKDYSAYFSDVGLLGTFIDNHDNPRFLNGHEGQTAQFKSALAFSLTTVGIPIVYYGSEQAFDGGNDPANRESLWPHYDTNADIYTFLTAVIGWRKKHEIHKYDQVQNYADDSFYAFSRGSTLAAYTNGDDDQTRTLTFLPNFQEGDKLCSLFDSGDTIVVTDGKLHVTVSKGLPKLYAKC